MSNLLNRDFPAFNLRLEGKLAEVTYFVINDWDNPQCNEAYHCKGKVMQDTPTHLVIDCETTIVVVKKTEVVEMVVHEEEKENAG